MDRKIKTIVKILLTVLMAIIILLILPKTENAYKSLTFNTPYSNFTIDGIPDGDYGSTANHFYELAHDLANSSSIEEFDNNNSNKWYYHQYVNCWSSVKTGDVWTSNDGYYIIRGGRPGFQKNFVNNVFCVENNNAGSNQESYSYIAHVLDIYPDKIVLDGNTYNRQNDGEFWDLCYWAYVLYHSSHSSSTSTQTTARNLFAGACYTAQHVEEIQNSVNRLFGNNKFYMGKQEAAGVEYFKFYDNGTDDYTDGYNNDIHARVYVVRGYGISQSRIVFKAEKYGGDNVSEEDSDIPAFTIIKEDFSGNNTNENPGKRLKGAEFAVYISNIESVTVNGKVINLDDIGTTGEWTQHNGLNVKKYVDGERISIKGLLTDQYGGIYLTNICALENADTMGMTISETMPPPGYVIEPKQLELTWKKENDVWNVYKNASETNNLSDNYWRFREQSSSTTAAVFFRNRKISIPSYNIVKEDFSGNKISGATFEVYLNNIRSVDINGREYRVDDLLAGSTKTTIGGITVKRGTGAASNALTIGGLQTDSNGEIKINEIVHDDQVSLNTDRIYMNITETIPADGFANLPKTTSEDGKEELRFITFSMGFRRWHMERL